MKVQIDKEKTACLTGHRPKSLPWGYDESQESCVRFKEELEKIFNGEIEYGVNTFLTGMAEGFDMIGAEILLEIRKNRNIKVIAVVPCIGQESKWKTEQQRRYKQILKKCDEVITLSEFYTPTCMNERNRFIVDHSSICVACWNGKASGTGNTVRYAKQNGNMVKIINPEDFR